MTERITNNEFQIKNNEMLFFVDYNKTLVNYDDIKMRSLSMCYDSFNSQRPVVSMRHLIGSLEKFEAETGITPVICIVTNATVELLDEQTGNPMMLEDFYNIFMRNNAFKNQAMKYFKYVMCAENDGFFKIHSEGKSFEESYEWIDFSDEIKQIKMIEQFKKCESVERILSVVDPMKVSKHIFFAGDSIKDDYPMKLARTNEGVCKYFVRPGRNKKMSPERMRSFCEAVGLTFDSVNHKGQKIRCFDKFNLQFLTPEDRKKLDSYSDDVRILLTQENSSGLINGIDLVRDLIAGKVALTVSNSNQRQ